MTQHVKFSPLVLLGALLLPQFKVSAHGFMEFPKARQSICEAQGGYWWPDDGSNIPNAACRAAFLVSGYVQFTQEHEFSVNVANYLNQAAVEAAVPNGSLCAAGSHEKRGINTPHADWQKTTVTPNSNGELAIRFRATTPHNPSFWKIYLSKPGFDSATQALGWQDLELINEFGTLEVVKDPDGKRYYDMVVNIPANRSGDAILYTRWQRNDVAGEGFYNCSDITFAADTGPVNWVSAGYFVSQGQSANVGDKVWARVFNGSGQELLSQLLTVTSANANNWGAELAQVINSQYGHVAQIGVKQGNGEIQFDSQNLLSNQVFVTDNNHTYNLTIQVAGPNTAPAVHQPDPLVLNEGQSQSLHVHAFDDEQTELSYDWQFPAPLSFTGTGATITISAPQVTQDTVYSGTITVSDGELSTTKTLSVTVKDVVAQNPAWSASSTYVGGNRVSHNGADYQAKWWTQGEEPGKADVWQKL
ncbi:lytic polysaccharide monooxygenase [Pseudoalteromonas fenneropenaei]|uniref:Lytic polysaccharide monooxygenase n=1 Tax=Pseudoalteromonas fenneropenaei TaxID=1737459 RepID=A0ABV7CGD0_9GAMM